MTATSPELKIKINEIFYSIQGEGYWTGTPAIFVRFSGCNRTCSFCDTIHLPFTVMSCDEIMDEVLTLAERSDCNRVVITGGEPTFQMQGLLDLVECLHSSCFRVHVETNGDFHFDHRKVEWLTVSPKDFNWKQRVGDELKLVYTGQSIEELRRYVVPAMPYQPLLGRIGIREGFYHFFLQPNDNKNVEATVDAVKKLPLEWRLSLQIHKLIGVR